jgi:hypothetical protein
MTIAIPSHLSDEELTAEVLRCAREESGATARLVAHLAEFDARRLYLPAGCSSLFAYCCKVMGLSEPAAYSRIEAARLARRFPVVLERLADGRLDVSKAKLLVPHLTEPNHGELLDAAARRSKRELEEFLARRFPRPDVPASVRKIPERAPRPVATDAGTTGQLTASAPITWDLPRTTPQPAPTHPTTTRRAVVEPLSAERYVIRFTASAALRDKLKRAQDLLRHTIPSGDPAAIFERGLSLLLDELARRKLAIVRKPANVERPTSSRSRHVPAEVRRSVWTRDEGCCAFVAADGRRCSESAFVEFHHVQPYGAGGDASVTNIELRCRAHNRYEAELFYGGGAAEGPDRVHERAEVAVSWGFRLVPERVDFASKERLSVETRRPYPPYSLATARNA